MKTIFKKAGFTLIEMLMVVIIIGILAVALVPKIKDQQARVKALKRKADIITIAKGIILYYIDTNSYPVSRCNFSDRCTVGETGRESDSTGTGFLPEIVPNYLTSFPSPPPGLQDGPCFGCGYRYMDLDGPGFNAGCASLGYPIRPEPKKIVQLRIYI